MVTSRQVVRPTIATFLPAVVAVMVAADVIEPLLRGHSIIESVKQIYLPLAIGEPLLISAGYATGLWLVRNKLREINLRQHWVHSTAGVVSVVALGVISVFSQGAHLPWIITASLAAGVAAAVAFFGFRSSARTVTASA